MKFPLSLLKRFLITDASLDSIGATLTHIGLEVESIEDKATALQAFVVAEILQAERHPNAEKLQVCQVKTANGTLQIVCGAPNARAGLKVALANIGTIIPANGMEIKKAAVRGVESQGMLCSAAELGLGADGDGIIELPLDATIGESIVDVLGLNDPVIDIAITANRGDCMGVYGVARDLAAAGLGTLVPPPLGGRLGGGPQVAHSRPDNAPLPTSPLQGEGLERCPITITIADADGCPAFLGRVIRGVKNGQSPQWLQDALTKSGLRPISTLVDITNYFTLAFGRPLHVYDLAKVSGGITVRRAADGEELLALNDKTYRLTTQCCVIADERQVLGIGGIMGGKSTAVSDSTTDILLEVALFNPERIAKTGRALMIDSDARTRFERGVDAGFVQLAELRASELILELCGGTPTQATLAGTIPTAQKTIAFSPDAINALGGTTIAPTRMKEILTALGFTFLNLPLEGGGRYEVAGGGESHPPLTPPLKGREYVIAPSWRHDVSQPADLAEEVLRIVGLDAIPATPLPKPTHIVRSTLNATQARLATIRRTLAARGLHETYGWGFCSEAQAAQFGGQREDLHLLNPISSELSVMRPNLLPHLLTAVANNAARGEKNLSLFEQGAVFVDATPQGQRNVAAGIRSGLRAGELHWSDAKSVDIYDVKADLGAILALAGLDIAKVQIIPPLTSPPQAEGKEGGTWYHPGRSGAVALGKTVIGYFGELHPSLLAAYGIDFPVVAFEAMLDALPAPKPAKRKALKHSDYQPVTRDFAFVLDKATPASELIAAIAKAEKNLLQNVALFDVYEGKGVAGGKKSLALTVTLQAADRTLAQHEIDAVAQAIIAAAAKIGAVLR